MLNIEFVPQQAGQQTTQPPANVARDQVREQVRQTVQDAMQVAKEAQLQAAADMKQAARDMRRANGDLSVQVPAPPVPPPPPAITYTTQFPGNPDVIPPQVVDIMAILGLTLVFCVIGFPLARAVARWIDRRGTSPTVPREVTARLESIEQAVESIAVEVERISEGQRFTTRLLSERPHEPAREFVVADPEAVPLASTPANARRS